MSGKKEKQARALARVYMGIDKKEERARKEFDNQVARMRHARAVEASKPIVSLRPKRKAFAYVALGLFVVAIAAVLFGGC